MKKILILSVLTLLLSSFTIKSELFTGKILYTNSFADLNGNDITDKLASYFGHEQHYFIDSTNYKAYDENNNRTQLYNSNTNLYYSFEKDKTAKKYDGSTQTSQLYKVTKLNFKEIIAGYECEALQVETENSTIIYYFSPLVKTNTQVFLKHNFGSWNKYLEATDGALPLKFVLTNNKKGYIWTSTAIEVTALKLTAGDFIFPDEYLLKN